VSESECPRTCVSRFRDERARLLSQLRALEDARSDERGSRILIDVYRGIASQSRVELAMLFELRREREDRGQRLLAMLRRHYEDVAELWLALRSSAPGTPAFRRAVQALEGAVLEHVERQEGRLLPVVCEHVPDAVLAHISNGAEASY
jgi:hypothetical protein